MFLLVRDFGQFWTVCEGHQSDLWTQFSAPPSTLKPRPSHTSAALTSPIPSCSVGIVTSQPPRHQRSPYIVTRRCCCTGMTGYVPPTHLRVYYTLILVSEITYYMSSGTLNPTHSLTIT